LTEEKDSVFHFGEVSMSLATKAFSPLSVPHLQGRRILFLEYLLGKSSSHRIPNTKKHESVKRLPEKAFMIFLRLR
jgi:hypothetical protein